MKHSLYLCVVFCTLLFAGCVDKDILEVSPNENSKPGIKVSMSLEGTMGNGNTTAGAKTRVWSKPIGYETNPANGFPIPVGLFDRGSIDGTELADGTQVPVLLIFRCSDPTQPITKVVTNWTYTKGGKLALLPSETFAMDGDTDLSKGKWFVCGILGGEMLPGNNQVKFNGYSEGHNAISKTGEKVTWGAYIPYIFGWRELQTDAVKNTIKAKDPVRFKQFGSIVRLKVTNNTDFDFKYNGVRIITSNILCGQFDLKAFEDKTLVPTTDLKDTKDSDVASAVSESYKKIFKPFKFYQRPLTDNAMIGENGLIKKRRFRIYGDYYENYKDETDNKKLADADVNKKFNTALYYYDHTFLPNSDGTNFDKVAKGQEAPSYIYVWMAPQEQTVKIYDGTAQGLGTFTTKEVAKTQFMLMAVPDGNGTAGKVVPTSINMIPAYGTLKPYVSGGNYPAKGSVVYNFAPLSYIAKHDNFGTDAELSSELNMDAAHTTRYKYTQVEALLPNKPAGYEFARNEYWRSFMSQYFAFSGLRNNGAKYNYSIGFVSPAMLPGWTGPKLVFHSYSKGVKVGGKTVAYMIGMSKKPDYITNDGEGQVYMGYAKQSVDRVSSGISSIPAWVTNNDYRYAMRWEDVNGAAVLTQRYLGPRFVLDMDDITNEDFWSVPDNYGFVYPKDVKRVFPYSGVNVTAVGGTQTFWYFDQNSVGKATQYWTPDDTSVDGRYNTKRGSRIGAMLDINDKEPKQSVNFIGPLNGDVVSGFYLYPLYPNVPKTGDQLGGAQSDPRFQLNFKMDGPVRLWRTTPYAD